MKSTVQALGADRISGIFTTLVVAGMAVYTMLSSSQVPVWQVGVACALYSVFCLLFWLITQDERAEWTLTQRLPMLLVHYALVVVLFYLVPFIPNAILLVIWSAQLPYFIRFHHAVITLPFWSLPPWLVFYFSWQVDHFVFTAVLFTTFNLFALVMMDSRRRAEQEQERAEQANRELKATQSLLMEAQKQSERTRIARDIHDLVGHHLTALTIHLQTAAHQADGEVKQAVERSHAIAKLLLSDVREAVSELRDQSGIDLQQSLAQLTQSIPGVAVTLTLSGQHRITDMTVALTLLRAVQESLTNSVRHGHADRVVIELETDRSDVTLRIEDNGRCAVPLQRGNGLTGIEERVHSVGGAVTFTPSASGFSTLIQIGAHS